MKEFAHPDEVHEVVEALHAHPAGPSKSAGGLKAALAELAQALEPSVPSLRRIDAATQPILIMALGIRPAEGQAVPATTGAAATAVSAAAAQREQQTVNNQAFHRAGALPIFASLLHATLAAHRSQVDAMYPSIPTPAAAADASSPPAARNPHDLFTRTPRFLLTQKLLRRTLTLLHALIHTMRADGAFIRSLFVDHYLMNLLFESLCLRSSPLAERTCPPEEDEQEGEADEFIVEYSSVEAGTNSPDAPKTPVLKKSVSAPATAAAAVGVDPSASIASAWWKSQAAASFKAGVSIAHVHSASFAPLTHILPLLALILESTRALLSGSTKKPAAAAAAAGAAASSAMPLAPTTAPSLYACQLQEICSTLAPVHGSIIYAPELVGGEPSSGSSLMTTAAAEPLTKAFPFITTEPLPPAVRAQLVALATLVVGASGKGAKSAGAPGPVADDSKAICSALVPNLGRYTHALARILLALTPGFTLSASVAGGGGVVGAAAEGDDDLTPQIDLRQLLLSSSSSSPAASLTSSALDASIPFLLRRTKEILLESTTRTLLHLRMVLDCDQGAADGAGSVQQADRDSLLVRLWQQYTNESGIPLILTKILAQDVVKSVAAHKTEGEKTLAVARGTEAWTKLKATDAPAALVLIAGPSTRLLRALSSCATLVHLSFACPSTSESLLFLAAAARAGVPRVLLACWKKYLSKTAIVGFPAEMQKTPELNALRERVALAYRAFGVVGGAGGESDDSDLKAFLAVHPSHAFHTGMHALLHASALSAVPASVAAATLRSGLSGVLCSADTAEILEEIALVSRRRFPYGEAAPIAGAAAGTASGRTSITSSGNNNGGGGGGGAQQSAPVESAATLEEGLGLGVLFQPVTPTAFSSHLTTSTVPGFTTILQEKWLLAQWGLVDEKDPSATFDPVAAALERNRTFSKHWDVHHEVARLQDERQAKLDRVLSLQTRCGDHAKTMGREYDFYTTSAGPPVVTRPPSTMTLGQYLLLADAERRWATELFILTQLQIELRLIRPSLAHRALPSRQTRVRRRKQERHEREEDRLEIFLASARASLHRVQAGPPGAHFFSHPFLPSSLTPQLVELLMRTSVAPCLKQTDATSRQAAILAGRIPLTEQQLDAGYQDLLANME